MLTTVRRRFRARRREERGATAIIAAFMCIVLFGVAALSVDLGNAFARRTDTQSQADYGALGAAQHQKETARSGMTISTAMVNAVVTAMNNNQPQDDKSTCWTTKTCVTAAQLTDANLDNGEIRYCGTGGPSCGSGYASTVKGLQVVAPKNKVDYGFANLLGVASGSVQGDALVNVYTAGIRVMPMYAVQGCDYGLQTLADPASGHTSPVVPTLAYNTDSTTTDLTAGSQVLKDSTGAVVSTLSLNSSNNTLTFEASKWSDSRYIGFFRGDNPDPALVLTENNFWLSTDATKTNLNTGSGYSNNPGTTVTVNVPNNVTQSEVVWWVRVFNGTDVAGKWSPKDEALPIRVGTSVLECASGSLAGNFGTLKFPRTDVASGDEIPANIANGLQKPLTAAVHDWAVANPGSAGLCTSGVDDAVTAPSGGVTLVPGVNCVDTDTGLSAEFATEGLVVGGTYGVGALLTAGTTPGCSPNGGNNNRNLTIPGGPYSINDDVLSCFFTNGSTSVADIAKESYNGGIVLSTKIFSSPRFMWVPVLAIQPGTGGSQTYSIIDFRAAFLTDETATSTAVKGSKTGTSDNGVTVQGSDIKQLKVVFFSGEALPHEGDFPLIDYLGTGQRVIRLLD